MYGIYVYISTCTSLCLHICLSWSLCLCVCMCVYVYIQAHQLFKCIHSASDVRFRELIPVRTHLLWCQHTPIRTGILKVNTWYYLCTHYHVFHHQEYHVFHHENLVMILLCMYRIVCTWMLHLMADIDDDVRSTMHCVGQWCSICCNLAWCVSQHSVAYVKVA